MLLGLALSASSSAHAIIFYSTGDPAYNTNAPAGELAGSGWELQGRWRVFLGTPIAPYYFLTAGHLGGAIGETFQFQGATYTTSAFFDDPATDLRIWRVREEFPVHAALYTNRDEAGRDLVAFGRGTRRGAVVTVAAPGPGQSEERGWYYGGQDGVMRWGQNRVETTADGGPTVGEVLVANFDADGGTNECHLSTGDSGGALFLHDGAGWKLAGIHYSVDGPFYVEANGTNFIAALYDQGGLFYKEGTNWLTYPQSQPGAFYSTRVSSRLEWIEQVLAQPIPPVLQAAPALPGTFQDAAGVTVDEARRTLTLPVPAEPRFYRLRALDPVRIQSITVQGTSLVVAYEFL